MWTAALGNNMSTAAGKGGPGGGAGSGPGGGGAGSGAGSGVGSGSGAGTGAGSGAGSGGAAGGRPGGVTGSLPRDGTESASDMDVASFFDGLITDDVVAIQAVVKDYTFSLRSPLPDLEELFFRVIKPHRNTLEYLGVFCAKLELAYSRALAREPTAASRLPASILSDLAAAFAPYIIRPNVWGAAQDVQTKRRAKFLQHRFVLLFWFFFKRKHNLVTRAERADLNRGSQEVRKESCTRAQAHKTRERGTVHDADVPLAGTSSVWSLGRGRTGAARAAARPLAPEHPAACAKLPASDELTCVTMWCTRTGRRH